MTIVGTTYSKLETFLTAVVAQQKPSGEEKMLKHVGRLKNNQRRLIVAYRTLPVSPIIVYVLQLRIRSW